MTKALCILALVSLAHAAWAQATITFEGYGRGSSGQELSTQIPGIIFEGGVYATTAPTIQRGNRPPGSAAVSGVTAAWSSGAILRFSSAASSLSARVSPTSIQSPGDLTRLFYLVGYDAGGEVARTSVLLPVGQDAPSANPFNPALIQLTGSKPMTYATLDWDSDFSINGTTFYFDDVQISPVPEPSTAALVLLAGIAFAIRPLRSFFRL